jgi:hypothetical protein
MIKNNTYIMHTASGGETKKKVVSRLTIEGTE